MGSWVPLMETDSVGLELNQSNQCFSRSSAGASDKQPDLGATNHYFHSSIISAAVDKE